MTDDDTVEMSLYDVRRFYHRQAESVFGRPLPWWHIGPEKWRTGDFAKIDPDGDLLYVGSSEHLTHRLFEMPHAMQGVLNLTDASTVADVVVAFWVRDDNWLYERFLQTRCVPVWSGSGISDKRRVERNKRRHHFKHGQRYTEPYTDPDRYVPGKFVQSSAVEWRAPTAERRRLVRDQWYRAGLGAAGVYAWLSVPAFSAERARAVLIGSGVRHRRALKRCSPTRQADEAILEDTEEPT
jgi:hypothetical protein